MIQQLLRGAMNRAMDLFGQLRNSFLKLAVCVPIETGGLRSFQLLQNLLLGIGPLGTMIYLSRALHAGHAAKRSSVRSKLIERVLGLQR